MDPAASTRSSAVKSRTSSLRTFTRRSTSIRGASSQSKGPIGLRTVFEPGVPGVADLIFVHGLNGGSHSTWTYENDASTFWPGEWLPEDEDFQDARIHTFGYSSSWEHESVLNIQDFAFKLLAQIKENPKISRDKQKLPLVLIGHSLGGLVIKKACMISKQRPDLSSISERVDSIYFLATPHGGSDLADILSRVLQVAGLGERPFMKEMQRNSPTIQAMNFDFATFAAGIRLFTFYETLPMNLGIRKELVVGKEEAQLNHANETVQYLEANHRDVARFPSRDDPSYVSIRNSLASTLRDLRKDGQPEQFDLAAQKQQDLTDLADLLGSPRHPEQILNDKLRNHLKGSGQWLIEKQSFCSWRDEKQPTLLWLQGKPGAGKSVLASLAIQSVNADESQNCCYFFFQKTDRQQCTIGAVLLSLARQLAALSIELMNALYLEHIFQVKPPYALRIVIDGLDECKQKNELAELLLRTLDRWHVPILVTSRDCTASIPCLESNHKVKAEAILDSEVSQDIKRYIAHHGHLIPAADPVSRGQTEEEILRKSAGCFLWVKLVFSQLHEADSVSDARNIINSMPSDMNEMYRTILEAMARADHGKPLAGAILRWTTYSSRPLTALELQKALEIELDDVIPNIEKAVARRCGHLVYFDTEKKLQPLHATVREFLNGDSFENELIVDRRKGHQALAVTCLKFLSGEELHLHPSRRGGPARDTKQERSPFIDYASTMLFDHISRAGAENLEVIHHLINFLDSPNVLVWIEYLASKSRLSHLLQAGKTIGRFLKQGDSFAVHGLSDVTRTLELWGTDLVRLVSKFGRQLRARPSAIFDEIAPFCPKNSMLHQRFASHRALHFVGYFYDFWDDCASVITHAHGETIVGRSVSSSHFALSTMVSREIVVYDDLTYQEIHRLQNEEPATIIAISPEENMLASAGAKWIKIWSLETWELLATVATPLSCISLAFVNEDTLLIVLKSNEIAHWDFVRDDIACVSFTKSDTLAEAFDKRAPNLAVIGVPQKLIAVAYRGLDLLIWDYEGDCLHDVFCREYGSRRNAPKDAKIKKETVVSLTFRRTPSPSDLIVSYFDGELILYNTQAGIVAKRVPDINAHSLVSSPDGRTLAAGDPSGTIHLFDFDSLKRLYSITFNANFLGVRSLSFTPDSLRLLDIRGKQCRIWEPKVLLRDDLDDDDNSDALSLSATAQEVEFTGDMKITYITGVASMDAGRHLVCGKDDGTVHIYETIKGEQLQELYKHETSVTRMFFDDKSKILATADHASTVYCHRIAAVSKSTWAALEIFRLKASGAVLGLLVSADSTRLLLHTTDQCLLFDLKSLKQIKSLKLRRPPTEYAWTFHPSIDERLLLFSVDAVHTYIWDNLRLHDSASCSATVSEDVFPFAALSEQDALPTMTSTIRLKQLPGSSCIAVSYESSHWQSKARTGRSIIWDVNNLAQPDHAAWPLPEEVSHVLGAYDGRYIFFHDDGWVWSMPFHERQINAARPHFFIPSEWLSLNYRTTILVTPAGDIAFPKSSHIIIIKRSLSVVASQKSSGVGHSGLGSFSLSVRRAGRMVQHNSK